MRLGLCCQFQEEPIRFRTTTATASLKLSRAQALAKLSGICLANARSLLKSLEYCHRTGIGCFRVQSQILPLRTHPLAGYAPRELPNYPGIASTFRACKRYASQNGIRLTFHPDQFVVLNSPHDTVVANSVRELEHQAEVAAWIGADVINIHAGGAYGDKVAALERFAYRVHQLDDRIRSRLTVENDDTLYTVRDLLPLCRSLEMPLVYDVHHHRCNGDDLSVDEATQLAARTWNREPLFHVSSPKDGWKGPHPKRHHDFISLRDVPVKWLNLDVTVEVEAKAKERAVSKLQKAIRRKMKNLA